MKKRILSMIMLMAVIFSVVSIPTAVDAAGISINKTSATITVGGSVQLNVLSDGTKVSGASWGSSDSTVAKVSSTGKVTGVAAGSAVITAMYNGRTVESIISVVKNTESKTKRYNVLILDCSGSVKGTPLKREKEAAKRFAQTVLSADGTNYVAVVSMGSSSKVVCAFTKSVSKVNSAINGLSASGETNMRAAFNNAENLMSSVSSGSNIMKNVIVCSDGLPTKGNTLTIGKYKSTDHKYYKYANSVYKIDTQMKDKNYFIYALGFFHNSKGNDLVFGKRFMKDLASKDKYYIINDSDDLDDTFGEIADTITNLTINKTSMTIYVGATAQLNAYYNGSKITATWKSSDKTIATVSKNGKVTGKKVGTVTIKATANGKTVSCKVTVKKPTITLSSKSISMYVKDTKTLKATVKGPSSTVTWKTSSKRIATVSGGKITAKAPGTCTITATANGVKATCKVRVYPKNGKWSTGITENTDEQAFTYTAPYTGTFTYEVVPHTGDYWYNGRYVQSTTYYVYVKMYVNDVYKSSASSYYRNGGYKSSSFACKKGDKVRVVVYDAKGYKTPYKVRVTFAK